MMRIENRGRNFVYIPEGFTGYEDLYNLRFPSEFFLCNYGTQYIISQSTSDIQVIWTNNGLLYLGGNQAYPSIAFQIPSQYGDSYTVYFKESDPFANASIRVFWRDINGQWKYNSDGPIYHFGEKFNYIAPYHYPQ